MISWNSYKIGVFEVLWGEVVLGKTSKTSILYEFQTTFTLKFLKTRSKIQKIQCISIKIVSQLGKIFQNKVADNTWTRKMGGGKKNPIKATTILQIDFIVKIALWIDATSIFLEMPCQKKREWRHIWLIDFLISDCFFFY